MSVEKVRAAKVVDLEGLSGLVIENVLVEYEDKALKRVEFYLSDHYRVLFTGSDYSALKAFVPAEIETQKKWVVEGSGGEGLTVQQTFDQKYDADKFADKVNRDLDLNGEATLKVQEKEVPVDF